jgi:glycerate kinase
LIAFLGALLLPGMDIVSDAVRLSERLLGASLVLTGEGSLDGQTLSGKAVAGVAGRAKALGIPVVAIAGQVSGDMAALQRIGITATLSISGGPVTVAEAMRDAAPLISEASERAIRLVRIPRTD